MFIHSTKQLHKDCTPRKMVAQTFENVTGMYADYDTVITLRRSLTDKY